MSLHVLHAGAGYRYLLRHTAAGDARPVPGEDLAGYYLHTGLPAGQWVGGGLAGLADGAGLPAGTPVDETALGRLFGRGHDPVTGAPLGRGLAIRRPCDGSVEVVGVAGYDLTFTVPKSVSVLWALGEPRVQQEILAGHHATIDALLGWAEQEIVLTRAGHGGAVPLYTRGLVGVRFDHWDSRAGDPNLHSHVAIANRVQGEDGVWRALDGRMLHEAAVALSELYDTLLADELTRRLGVDWMEVDRGPDRNPGFEIAGVAPELLDLFSSRAHDIAATTDGLVAEFAARHGRPPSGPQMSRLRQTATLATRPAKTVHGLGMLRQRWADQARTRLGTTAAATVGAVVAAPAAATESAPHPSQLRLTGAALDTLVGRVVAGVARRRSTWSRLNLLAETARATRGRRSGTVRDRLLLLEDVLEDAEQVLVPLHERTVSEPGRRWRARWTSRAVLDAEDTLLTATSVPGPALPARDVDRLLATAGTPTGERLGLPTLSPEHARAVAALARDPTLLRLLEGPAGSGKTTTLRALTSLWQTRAGPGSVVGLAPSASAAATLAAALGVPCENTAKWIHETTGPGGQRRAALLDRLLDPSRRDPAAAADLLAAQARWTLPRGGLLIVDEAGLADTYTLAELTRQAHTAGAAVLLVGDPHQAGPVGAGGALGLLTRHHRHPELAALHRYTQPWEAAATLALRHGHLHALDAYAAHGRLHTAPAGTAAELEREQLIDAAHTAWAAAVHAGRDALLLAPDADTVRDLNRRARTARVLAGEVTASGIRLRDDTTAGTGDQVRARRNNRHLTDPAGHWLRNGDLLTITAVHPDGSLAARRSGGPGEGAALRLPASYAAEHVELGYALTVHRAQGLTVDEAHLVLGPGTTRETLYVGMTRGRDANHAWVTTTAEAAADHDLPAGGPPVRSAADVLRTALATTGAERSATEHLIALTRRALPHLPGRQQQDDRARGSGRVPTPAPADHALTR